MLRITQQSSSQAAKSYYTTSDYLSEGQELAGVWGGKGAERLGLRGLVGRAEFDRLCENRHPRDGRPLTARTKSERTVGYDFTWSVPKSVSLLYALTKDECLLTAFRGALRETMQELEYEAKVRIRGKGQNAERVTGNLAWAEFVHFTSRPIDGIPDPQLHAHCFAFNTSWDDAEKRWKAGQFRDLKRDAPLWQAAFRVRLANRLQELGFALEKKRDDFEIAGLSAALLRKFSRRTEKIEELARELGIENPDAKGKLGAKSRERKAAGLSWDELRESWAGRLTPEEYETVIRAGQQRQPGRVADGREAAAIDFALQHCFEREAVVDEKRLATEALKQGLGSVRVEDVWRELARRQLLVDERDGRRLATTPAVLAEEERYLAFAREGRGTCRPMGEADRPWKRDWLNAGQRRAVEHVLASRDRVILLRGAAGTGKSTLMQEAVDGIREGGHDVVVLAPSAAASRENLREGGLFPEADTVARFLRDESMQQKASGQVVWVDEAGLLGSRDLAALFDVADRVGARVIVMGDRFQHSSPARGSPLRLLETEAGVPAVAVTEIIRQRDDNYRRAVRLLSEGKTAEGFAVLDRLGCIMEVAGDQRYRALAEAYLQAVDGKNANGESRTALVVSPTHSEKNRITAAIREGLRSQGKLKDEREFAAWMPANLTEAERGQADSYAPGDMLQFHQNAKGYGNGQRVLVARQDLPLGQAARFQVYHPTTLRLAVGDRIRVTANGTTQDGKHRLTNGSLLTVRSFNPQGHVIVDHGWVIDKAWGHLTHGYATTSHSSQSKTVDQVIIGQSSLSAPAASQAQFYVSASRGRDSVRIFTDDKQAMLQAVQRGEERLTATELVRRRVGFQRLKHHLSFLRRSASLFPSPGLANTPYSLRCGR